MSAYDTIAAIATPPGRGGVGVIRISGPLVKFISHKVLSKCTRPREAILCRFLDERAEIIDEGLALSFPSPHSFTGEDVLELQGHGSPVALDLLLQRVLSLGARLARAGEFSERAFLNGKIDLTQAEAIADLIDAGSAASAKLASRTLQGIFSEHVHKLVAQLIQLRLHVESAIDFPEEEIDFLSENKVSIDLHLVIEDLKDVKASANRGRLLRDGMTLVIAGLPNAGKSSLLNALAGQDTAIVTEIPGTTRDLLREMIQIDGMPLHVIDTAGLRESTDRVEQEGIRRARLEIEQADRILWIFDDSAAEPDYYALEHANLPVRVPLTLVRNKIDLSGKQAGIRQTEYGVEVSLAAKTGLGMDQLRAHLKQSVGYFGDYEGEFIARRRHLDALERALEHLVQGERMLKSHSAGELLAEDLRLAQLALNEITGEFCADDLLGRIFSSFCIGK